MAVNFNLEKLWCVIFYPTKDFLKSYVADSKIQKELRRNSDKLFYFTGCGFNHLMLA